MTPAERAREIVFLGTHSEGPEKVVFEVKDLKELIAAALVDFGEAEYRKGFEAGQIDAAEAEDGGSK